jgi:hypothetical protein
MKHHLLIAITSAAFTAGLVGSAHAQEEDEATAKLREALRGVTMQLRDAQGQIANLQATEIANKTEIDKLTSEVKKLNTQAMEERNASANAISDLNNKLVEKEAENTGHRAALEKWRKDYGTVIERARNAESARDKNAAQILNLERLVNDQRAQNVRMYLVGQEVLKRYDKFWFGDALLAREPFVSTTKVKLQNLAQDGHDKLLAARILDTPLAEVKNKKPEPPQDEATPESTPAASAASSPRSSETPRQTASASTPKPKKQKPGERETAWPAAQPN